MPVSSVALSVEGVQSTPSTDNLADGWFEGDKDRIMRFALSYQEDKNAS